MSAPTVTAQPMAVRPVQVQVTSARDPRKVYNVTLPSCDCPDFRYRRNGLFDPCKHLIAADQAVGGWHDPERAELARRIEQAIKLAGNDAVLVAVLNGSL
jgi:SWIM zinc finger